MFKITQEAKDWITQKGAHAVTLKMHVARVSSCACSTVMEAEVIPGAPEDKESRGDSVRSLPESSDEGRIAREQSGVGRIARDREDFQMETVDEIAIYFPAKFKLPPSREVTIQLASTFGRKRLAVKGLFGNERME